MLADNCRIEFGKEVPSLCVFSTIGKAKISKACRGFVSIEESFPSEYECVERLQLYPDSIPFPPSSRRV